MKKIILALLLSLLTLPLPAQKISALPAASSAAGANEFEINEAGTSKKVTGSQIQTFVLGNAFIQFTGPTTSVKTYTLPNANAILLTDQAAVTVAQGGTGAATLTGILQGNGTSAITGISNSSTVGQVFRVTGASTYAWGALNLADTDAVTGTLPNANVGATPVPTPGTSITLTAPRGIAICTGTCTVTVPVPAAGYEFCIMNDNNVSTAITLSALGSSAMYQNTEGTAYGTAGTGTLVSTAALGNAICLFGRDSTHYLTRFYQGVFTAN